MATTTSSALNSGNKTEEKVVETQAAEEILAADEETEDETKDEVFNIDTNVNSSGADNAPPLDFWEVLEKPADINTYVWLAGMVLEVNDAPSRAFLVARSKTALIDRVYQVLTSEELGWDASQYLTKTKAIRGYFDGHDNRDIFFMLCPVE